MQKYICENVNTKFEKRKKTFFDHTKHLKNLDMQPSQHYVPVISGNPYPSIHIGYLNFLEFIV